MNLKTFTRENLQPAANTGPEAVDPEADETCSLREATTRFATVDLSAPVFGCIGTDLSR